MKAGEKINDYAASNQIVRVVHTASRHRQFFGVSVRLT